MRLCVYELVRGSVFVAATIAFFLLKATAAEPQHFSLMSPYPLSVYADQFSSTASPSFDQFSRPHASPSNLSRFKDISVLTELQRDPTGAWRLQQSSNLDNKSLFGSQSLSFTTQKTTLVPQPGTQSDCADNDDECTKNSGLPHSHSIKIGGGNLSKGRKPFIGLSVDVPIK